MLGRLLIIICLPTIAFASGGEGHHEPALIDLLWPAISFTTLFSFIFIKIRKPIQKIFDKKAVEVEALYKEAKERKKEAKSQLDNNKNKLLGVEADRQKIKSAVKTAAEEYTAKIHHETELQIKRLEEETKSIIEYEKKKQIKDINAQFVEGILAKAKEDISGDKDLRGSASEKLLQQIH